ncbi:MAG: hypothetical protein IKN49_03510 [Elusimicrobiaceae bacterium]|nr:hypothetical protein [Elusimicrobiaceae bacterium]
MPKKISPLSEESHTTSSLFPLEESAEKKPRKSRRSTKSSLSYQPAFCQQLLCFFDVPPFRVTEVQKKDGSISLVETASELPTFAAFARHLGTTQAQLMKWEEKYPDFAEAAKKARDLQGDILIQNSLRGNYSSSFAVFTAKNILGWTDGKDTPVITPKHIVVHWEKE